MEDDEEIDDNEAVDDSPPAIEMPLPEEPSERAEQVEQLFDLFDESDDGDDADPALDSRISDAVSELVGYYADVDLPPVVQRLAQLVAERDYKTVRDEVDDIWNQLLRYHKQKKLRPELLLLVVPEKLVPDVVYFVPHCLVVALSDELRKSLDDRRKIHIGVVPDQL